MGLEEQDYSVVPDPVSRPSLSPISDEAMNTASIILYDIETTGSGNIFIMIY